MTLLRVFWTECGHQDLGDPIAGLESCAPPNYPPKPPSPAFPLFPVLPSNSQHLEKVGRRLPSRLSAPPFFLWMSCFFLACSSLSCPWLPPFILGFCARTVHSKCSIDPIQELIPDGALLRSQSALVITSTSRRLPL